MEIQSDECNTCQSDDNVRLQCLMRILTSGFRCKLCGDVAVSCEDVPPITTTCLHEREICAKCLAQNVREQLFDGQSVRLNVLSNGVRCVGQPKCNARYEIAAAMLYADADVRFRTAETLFQRTQPPRFTVVNVEFVYNEEINRRYEESRRAVQHSGDYITTRYVFHGTSNSTIPLIVEQGFKVGGTKGIPIVHGDTYGSGVYSTEYPTTAAGLVSGGCMKLLLCELCVTNQTVVHGSLTSSVPVGIFVQPEPHLIRPIFVVEFTSPYYRF